jgi:hypothetical protein
MVLKEVFGPKRDELTGKWKRLHNGGALWSVLSTKYYLLDQNKKNEIGRA